MKHDQQTHDALTETVRSALAIATQEKLRQALAENQRLQDQLNGVKVELEEECKENESLDAKLQEALISEARALERAAAAGLAMAAAEATVGIERARCSALEKRIDSMMTKTQPKVKGWNIEVQKDGADVTRRLVLTPAEDE